MNLTKIINRVVWRCLFMLFNIKDFTKDIRDVRNRTNIVNYELTDYITLFSGLSASGESFIRRVGDTIELYIVVNGTFPAGTKNIFTLNRSILPYSASNTRRFPLVIPAIGYSSNVTIDTTTGIVTAVIPANTSAVSVALNAVYTIK